MTKQQIPEINGVQDSKAAIILRGMKSIIEEMTGRSKVAIQYLDGATSSSGIINKINEVIARLQGDEVNVKNDGLSTLAVAAATDSTHAIRASQVLGYGQVWTDVKTTPGRVADGTVYTNTTGKPIEVAINVSNSGASGTFGVSLTIGGVTLDQYSTQSVGAGNMSAGIVAIVPNGISYSAIMVSATLSKWYELR